MRELEMLLTSVSTFEALRPDELARVAARFEALDLAPGETKRFSATPEDMRLVIVVRGAAKLELDDAGGVITSVLGAGDRWGELELVANHPRGLAMRAERPTTLALLDRAGFDAILREFPVIALPLAADIASELHATIDTSRELAELRAERLPPAQLAATITRRRRSHLRRRARVRRSPVRGLFARFVVQQGREPPFWILVGFVVSLCLARLVVGLILHFGLQKQLFALVPGHDPNPMHVHHFNYGLILVGVSGITALFPFGRRMLRFLSFVFGFGMGLVLDEFALFWNLNPSYKNAHLTAAELAAVLLFQVVYFRRLWAALARHTWHRIRSQR